MKLLKKLQRQYMNPSCRTEYVNKKELLIYQNQIIDELNMDFLSGI